jgi:hypothetical protein
VVSGGSSCDMSHWSMRRRPSDWLKVARAVTVRRRDCPCPTAFTEFGMVFRCGNTHSGISPYPVSTLNIPNLAPVASDCSLRA